MYHEKFNLFKEIIVVQRADFMRAVNSSKHFAITYEGYQFLNIKLANSLNYSILSGDEEEVAEFFKVL